MSYGDDQRHSELARYIQEHSTLKWLMSYDDTAFIRNLYANCTISSLPLEYSLQRRRKAEELLISPHHLVLADTVNSVTVAASRTETSSTRKTQ